MADIRIEVYWSPDSKSALTVKDTDTVDHVIEQVRVRTGDQFRKDDDDGHRIIYSLFRVDDQADEALDRDGILHRIGLTDGAKLYLDRPGQMHWWRGIQVRLTDGCVVPVPNDGLRINRGYLLHALPFRVTIVERFKLYIGRETPLRSVSRRQHCEIVRQGDQWRLYAFSPTSIDGYFLNNGESTPITSPTCLVLGREGWPIEIQLTRL